MKEEGISRMELSEVLGHKSKLSEILSKKRELSKKMIKALHDTFGIPYEVLMG